MLFKLKQSQAYFICFSVETRKKRESSFFHIDVHRKCKLACLHFNHTLKNPNKTDEKYCLQYVHICHSILYASRFVLDKKKIEIGFFANL